MYAYIILFSLNAKYESPPIAIYQFVMLCNLTTSCKCYTCMHKKFRHSQEELTIRPTQCLH